MKTHTKPRLRGFSLIELVIVVVIIAIIGAIAIPRMSRGAAGASDSALTANLSVLRSAVDLYHTEHGGIYPEFGTIVLQLTTYSNAAGTSTSPTKDATHIYGPYLRKVPPLPVGGRKGATGITDTAGTANMGWVYDDGAGTVIANTDPGEADDAGVDYNTY